MPQLMLKRPSFNRQHAFTLTNMANTFLLHESVLLPFQVLPNASQEYDITWYVSCSPCVSCASKLASILQQRKKVSLRIFCSRLFEWEQQEIVEGLRALASAGCKLRMMKPCDFLLVWETYVEKEGQSFTPWEDCQENYDYYMEKLADILKQMPVSRYCASRGSMKIFSYNVFLGGIMKFLLSFLITGAHNGQDLSTDSTTNGPTCEIPTDGAQ